MSSAKSENVTPSLAILMTYFIFCLIADARTSNPMLNNSGDSGHPCHVPDLRGKALSVSPLRMILSVGFSYMAFMMFRYVSSIPTFLRIFIKKGCFFVKCFFCLY